MPRNSIGVYTPPSSTWNPASPDTPISSTDWNTLLSDIADAFTGSLAANGSTPVTGEFSFSYGIIGNVTGSVTGNVTGDITGNGFGTWTGPVAGNVTGNVMGNLTGNGIGTWTGPVVGNVTGNVTGSSGSCTGNAATATSAASATSATTATTATTANAGAAGFTINGLRGARVSTGFGANTGKITLSGTTPGTLDEGEIWLQYV